MPNFIHWSTFTAPSQHLYDVVMPDDQIEQDVSKPEKPTLSPGPHRTLDGIGLLLRPWELDEAEVLVEMAKDPLTQLWNGFGTNDLPGMQAWIERQRIWLEGATWAIHDAATDQVLGSISLFHLDGANSSGEIGYGVASWARGQGVAGRAVTAVSQFGFGELALERIELFHAIENTSSCRVATKAGFVQEGVLRKSYRYADGLLHDEHIHARLRTD